MPLTLFLPSHLCFQICCLVGSVTFHLLNSLKLDAKGFLRLLIFDVTCVWLLNTIAGVCYLTPAFHCSPFWKNIVLATYITICLLAVVPGVTAQTPFGRVFGFAAIVVFRLSAILLRQYASFDFNRDAFFHYVAMDVYLITASLLNAMRWPESSWPGKFDLYFSR